MIVTAGTSDIPVAEEARETDEIMGNNVKVLFDAGVAGIHRLLSKKDYIMTVKVIIVIAGMEAALASVVGGNGSTPCYRRTNEHRIRYKLRRCYSTSSNVKQLCLKCYCC